MVKQRRDRRRASVCGTGRASPNSLTHRGVDTERTARVPRALSCSAESVGPGSVRDAWVTLLLANESEESADAGGEGGREYNRITGRRRRGGAGPGGGGVGLVGGGEGRDGVGGRGAGGGAGGP